jgi:Domain of unknown function (DUF4252)
MKLFIVKSLRFIPLLLLFAATLSPAAQAQDFRLQLDDLSKLEARASQSVDVSLDGKLLELAGKFLNSSKPEEAAVKELVMGLRGIYVKSYEFDKEGEYSVSDMEAVRAQLRSPAWTRMFGAKSKKQGENLEVYMMVSGSVVNGIALLATEPKQLSVIQIVGSIDLEKLVRLSGKFGIPSIQIKTDGKEPKE